MLKIGVIGAGELGEKHIESLLKIEDILLIGFFEIDNSRAQYISEKYNIEAFSSMELLINETDAITIATPTISHFEYAFYTLKKSKHIFIEKPLTYSIEEAKILMDIAREANVNVQIGHIERFNPSFIASLPYIQQPMFIEAHRLAQYNSLKMKDSVILDLMIDDIDIILSIVKSNIRKISASGVSVVSNTPDIANARIEFDNGCVANITASRISLKNMQKMRLFQRDAYISMDFLSNESEIIKINNSENVHSQVMPFSLDLGINSDKKKIFLEKPTIIKNNPIQEELESFVYSIKNNKTPKVSLFEGFQALELARKIIDKIEIASVC